MATRAASALARVAVALTMVLTLAACEQTATCRPGTVFLSFSLPSEVQLPANANVTVSVAGTDKTSAITVHKREGSVEVRFPSGYPVGQSATFSLTIGSTVLSTSAMLLPGCTSLTLKNGADQDAGGLTDGPAGDLIVSPPDLTEFDFNSCVILSCEQQGIGCGDAMNGCGVPISCGACTITATAPIIAEVGEQIYLEGRFGLSATVSFPGGTTLGAEVLGPNRIRVQVPASATAGLLTVETGGATTNPVRFTKTAFKLGLAGPIQRQSTQTLYGATTSDLDIARDRAATITTGPYVHSIGGQADTGVQSTISKARRNADGSLLGFVQGSSSLMEGRRSHAAVQIGSRLYVIGGAGAGGAIASIESAVVQADGTLGPFVQEQSTLTQGREAFAIAVVGKYVYVLGGFGSTGETLATVERALIQDDGGLATFASFGTGLVTPRAGGQALIVGANLYLVGGASTTSSEIAAISADGSLGDFASSDQSGALVLARQMFGLARLGSQVVVMGGSGGSRTATVETATIGVDGVLSNFATAPQTLKFARSGLSLVNTGSDLQIIGGITGSSPEWKVERVDINASGGLGTFSAYSQSQLNVARGGSACAVVGDKLYVIGGGNPLATNDVEEAPLTADGKLGPFTAIGKLNEARSNLAIVRDQYKLTVVGGNNDTPAWVATPETATIAEDGDSIGSFATVAASAPPWRHRPVFVEDIMNIVGGISPDDKLAAWNAGFAGSYTEKAFGLTTPRTGASILTIIDRVHVIGGSYKPSGNPTVYPTTIERSVMGTGSSSGSITSFENQGDLPVGRRNAMTVTVGGAVYLLGGTNTAATTDVLKATIDATGQLSTFSTAPSLMTSARISGGCAVRVGNYVYLIGSVPNGSPWIEYAPLN